MKPLNQLIAAAVAASLLVTPIAPTQASGATGGATELTQLLSWARNETQWVSQLSTMASQLRQLQSMFTLQGLMNQVLPDVGGLVRDASELRGAFNEVMSMKNDIQSAMGALQDLRSFSDVRFQDMSNFYDQFGNRKTAQDFFIQQMRSNAGQHKMNNIMRDQEVSALKRLESTTKAIQKHAEKIPTTAGVHQAVSLLSTQMNTMVAMAADANKVILTKSMRDTQKDDEALAQSKLNAEEEARRRTATEAYFRTNTQALGR